LAVQRGGLELVVVSFFFFFFSERLVLFFSLLLSWSSGVVDGRCCFVVPTLSLSSF
jgi:hypothetical protein